MISALAWVPRGAAKPVIDDPLPVEEELAALEVRMSLVEVLTRVATSKAEQGHLQACSLGGRCGDST